MISNYNLKLEYHDELIIYQTTTLRKYYQQTGNKTELIDVYTSPK